MKKKAKSEAENVVVAYKGFSSELKCRDFQFEVGKSYEHKGAIGVCQSGFHACQDPWDVLEYYPFLDDQAKINRFCRVSMSGEVKTDGNKSCSAKISIDCEFKLGDFIAAIVTRAFEKINFKDLISKTKSTKDGSKLAASGYGSKLAASGNYSNLAASGNDSKLAASGNYSNLAASGNDSKLAASGYGSKLAASGNRGVLVSAERDCYVKGLNGTLICLCLYDSENKAVKLVTGKIGEENLKPDTWYGLDKFGNFIEVNL